MMTSLFSIFDPNNNFINFNWISSMLNFLIIPMYYWIHQSRFIKLFNLMFSVIQNELKIILFNKFNKMNMIYFITMFMFILLNNFMGLFPYIFTSSSHMIFSLFISLPLWLSLMMFLWLNNTNYAFAHLIPQGTPFILMPFMVLIETISNLIRPMTLSVRLTANMIAGHLLLTLMSQSAMLSSFSCSMMIVIMQIMLLMLEFSVSIIQSYVFTILSTLYFKETNYVKIKKKM